MLAGYAFNLVEGEKPPKNEPLKITNEIYKVYVSRSLV
jgi:hypothetical protein